MVEPSPTFDVLVRDEPAASRYELHVDGELAGFADYHLQPGLITVLSTEIDPAFTGQGLGATFIARMLKDIRSRGTKVLAVCPFVRAYLQRHPENSDLVWKP
jgi:predicted GNAT family acetyltransferase